MDKNTQQMLNGEPYEAGTPKLSKMMQKAHLICAEYNQLSDDHDPKREALLQELIPNHGDNCYLQGPIHFDYGRFTKLGKGFYANYNFTVLDVAPVTIGDNVLCGPGVTIATAMHPLMWQQRNPRTQSDGKFTTVEYAKPIVIDDNCWLASNVTVCPGVHIGAGSVIAAGAVVTHDIPANSLAAGVPAKVIREITPADRCNHYPY